MKPMIKSRWGGIVFGFAIAAISVWLRAMIHLPREVLPIALTVPTVLVAYDVAGRWGGITAFVVGGVALDQIMPPHEYEGSVLLGYFASGLVIVVASEMNLRAERSRLTMLQERTQYAETIADEFKHRVKNLLAVVQSLVAQSIGIDEKTRENITARLGALADSQDLLDHGTGTGKLLDLVKASLEPFNTTDSIEIVGGDCVISEQQSVWLVLALHELATNAAKYGALSIPRGRVRVEMHPTPRGSSLLWREYGGPPVSPPTTPGFGSKLLERAHAEVEYRPEGLRCFIPRIDCVKASPA